MFKFVLGAAGTLVAIIGLGAAYREGYKDGMTKYENTLKTIFKTAEVVERNRESE